MKIPIRVISKVSGKVINGSCSPRKLLDFYEEQLVEYITKCDCSPIGETNVIDCACYEEWEDYDLLIGDEVIQQDKIQWLYES